MSFFLTPFIFFLVVSSLLIFSCDSFFMTWAMMEINMLSFICYLVYAGFKENKGEALQYLFIQSVPSLFFLTSCFLMDLGHSPFIFFSVVALMIKLGAAPFHFWFLKMVTNLSWESFYLLSTIQKLLPLLVLNKLGVSWMIIVVITALVSSLGVFSSNNLKVLLAYSSLFSLSWMLSVSGTISLFIFFLVIYSFNLFFLISLLLSIESIQLFSFSVNFGSSSNNFLFFLSLLSMGGLPPLLGFLGKIYVMNFLLVVNGGLAFFLLMLSSLLLYLYLRLCFSAWKLVSTTSSFNVLGIIKPWYLFILSPLILLI